MVEDEVVPVSLDDVGSRYIHLADLLEMWEIGAEIVSERIQRMSAPSSSDLPDKLKKMQVAIELLRGTLDGMSDRVDYEWKLGNQIDALQRQKDF